MHTFIEAVGDAEIHVGCLEPALGVGGVAAAARLAVVVKRDLVLAAAEEARGSTDAGFGGCSP